MTSGDSRNWFMRNWQLMSAVAGIIALAVVMNETVKANAKDILTQGGQIEGQRKEIETLKQRWVRVDEQVKGINDKIDRQTRTVERILDVVTRK